MNTAPLTVTVDGARLMVSVALALDGRWNLSPANVASTVYVPASTGAVGEPDDGFAGRPDRQPDRARVPPRRPELHGLERGDLRGPACIEYLQGVAAMEVWV